MAAVEQTVAKVVDLERYKHGFVSEIEQEFAPKGLTEETIRFISAKKGEPDNRRCVPQPTSASPR